MMQLAQYISNRLKEQGCIQVFGVPGSYIIPIWQSISLNHDLILGCHETGAGFMADGWARGTRFIFEFYCSIVID